MTVKCEQQKRKVNISMHAAEMRLIS